MAKDYVIFNEGVYRLAGSRISLDSLVYLYQEGLSPESMVDSYPSLSLEQIHGALAFYLANKDMIDSYMDEVERKAEIEYQKSLVTNAELIAKLRRARNAAQVSG